MKYVSVAKLLSFKVFDILIFVKFVQFVNAPEPIVSTLIGISIDLNSLFPLNAFASILVIVSDMVPYTYTFAVI